MKYLSDIPDIKSHCHFSILEKSDIYAKPLRFLDENALVSLYIEAKEQIGEENAGDLVKHVVATVSLANFLGLCETPRIDTFQI
ncbi:hypothetical protein KI655_18520 [Vibrio sp. D404a]|uniref:hypothetical protein n=1 Tax=unclassified Vibrio TaxID=2614977 RepID=UPI002553972E|nr:MULTISPECIES: hypothetical protein [unclassified Vibrio]MDK9739293.1 hypothetical protein [Vibrio sp. D404a]MDK9797671.1 hypothetical protein [Vibrio sp. D449a]